MSATQDFNLTALQGQFILQYRVHYLEAMASHFQAKLDEARQQLTEATNVDSPVEPETTQAENPQGIEPNEQPNPQGIIKPLTDKIGQIKLPVRALSALTGELKRRMSNQAVSHNGGQR